MTAGGIPNDEFTLGDVIVSTRIINFNVGAENADGTTEYVTRGGTHPRIGDITGQLPGEDQLEGWNDATSIRENRPEIDVGRANIVGPKPWPNKVRESLKWHFASDKSSRPPVFKTGHVASSNRLIKNPEVLIQWLGMNRSILAIEMEAAGVYEAAQTMDRQYPVMAIRGISDIVGLKRDAKWTAYACETAAAFTYHFILTAPIDPRMSTSSQAESAQDPALSYHQRLDGLERASRARCVALWQEAGVPRAMAETFANDTSIGQPPDSLAPGPEKPVVCLIGDLGLGKTITAERIFQQAIGQSRADADAPIPVHLRVADIKRPLEELVIAACAGLGDPLLKGAAVVIDTAVALGGAGLGDLLAQSRILTGTWPHTTVILASRPLPVIAQAEEAMHLAALTEQAAITLVGRIAGDEAKAEMPWPAPIRQAICRPLLAVLLVLQR